MYCLDCKAPTQMKLDSEDHPVDKSYFELILRCPRCDATFFGTMYRDLEQALNEPDCVECEEKKDV